MLGAAPQDIQYAILRAGHTSCIPAHHDGDSDNPEEWRVQRTFACTMSQISRQIRTLCLSIPSLWSVLDLGLLSGPEETTTLLARSRGGGLTIRLYNPMGRNIDAGTLELICAQASRWKKLHVSYSYNDVRIHRSLCRLGPTHFTMLAEFDLRVGASSNTPHFLQNWTMPGLTRFTWHNLRVRCDLPLTTSMAGVKALHISEGVSLGPSDMALIAQLLRGLPYLEDLAMEFRTYTEPKILSRQVSETVFLPSLQKLSITVLNHAKDSYAWLSLSLFNTPNLVTLSIGTREEDEGGLDIFTSNFNFPTTLEALSLRFQRAPFKSVLSSRLAKLPQLRLLTLEGMEIREDGEEACTFLALTRIRLFKCVGELDVLKHTQSLKGLTISIEA